ncbi:hypothetical protein ABTZ99_42950 [Actinosynnema sp. NPDC002837]
MTATETTGRRATRLFLVECYLPGADPDEVATAMRSVVAAGREAAAFACCLAIPGDDSYFCLFNSGTTEDLELTFRRAGVPFERIVEATQVSLGVAEAALARLGE